MGYEAFKKYHIDGYKIHVEIDDARKVRIVCNETVVIEDLSIYDWQIAYDAIRNFISWVK